MVRTRGGDLVAEGIRTIEADRDAQGNNTQVRLVFGPHYFVELHWEESDTFVLGATHDGFKADALDVGGELERFIDEVRQAHPENLLDLGAAMPG
jgi:hypothetical protein